MLKDLTRADLPRLVVLSQREIPRDTPVEIVGTVVEEEPAAVVVDRHDGWSVALSAESWQNRADVETGMIPTLGHRGRRL